ncbi:hypothetical protein HNY73_016577 [Argiope bruennichi]|uniref:Uncharacterized protein n=1 Tax=Argiope bruennichi TaxID=94029 RepID=A0A8T0EJ76_ARGBR|nr:hypothetical protein HNY73_016577 [Argiope bruennichi]
MRTIRQKTHQGQLGPMKRVSLREKPIQRSKCQQWPRLNCFWQMGKEDFVPPKDRRVFEGAPGFKSRQSRWSCQAPPKLRAPKPGARAKVTKDGKVEIFQDEFTRALLLEYISWKVKGQANSESGINPS